MIIFHSLKGNSLALFVNFSYFFVNTGPQYSGEAFKHGFVGPVVPHPGWWAWDRHPVIHSHHSFDKDDLLSKVIKPKMNNFAKLLIDGFLFFLIVVNFVGNESGSSADPLMVLLEREIVPRQHRSFKSSVVQL